MNQDKKTKIVATIGPASEDPKTLKKLVDAGMNVMRLNFSHGDFAEHQRRVNSFRKIAQDTDRSLGILQDLGGPKIRIGDFDTETVTLKKGKTFILTTEKIFGTEDKVSINYKKLPKEVSAGDSILLDDGKCRLVVKKIDGSEIHTSVVVGGKIRGKRGVNLPDTSLSIGSLTPKDKKDIAFGVKNEVEYIALSFVRRASDVRELRAILKRKKSRALIIAKIETAEAVDNFEEILKVADGIMVARGDLAIEVPNEKVPTIQKNIINRCNRVGKPVITATQMLESMIGAPVPTRAEVSDIANAIIDGTDAVMLSGETALGQYPIEAVEVMTRVAIQLEKETSEQLNLNGGENDAEIVTDSITQSVVKTAHDIDAKAIIALTDTGFTARMIARHQPQARIFALSSDLLTCNQLALSYGCTPIKVLKYKTVRDAFVAVKKIAQKAGAIKKGDRVVIAAGAPFHETPHETNMLLVEEV